jgi:gentisate 1,2-dioxygenase
MSPRVRPAGDRDAFYRELLAVETAPFWEVVDRSSSPVPATVPHHWRWSDVEPLLRRAGEMIDTDEAERRVLMLVNPATRGDKRAVGNLYAGLQLVLPGEAARAHRHTASALRFVLQGGGASTIVEGATLDVARFDLVLTPSWMWHDHVNRGTEPVIWLDALDSPLTRALDAWFFEPHPEGFQTVGDAPDDATTATLRYGWAEMSSTLAAALEASGEGSVVRDYTDPVTGRDVLPTMRCRALQIGCGASYGPVRRVGAGVFCVVEGTGTAHVASQRLPLEFGDVFGVPSWCRLEIRNDGPAPLSLFAYDDEPVLRALGLARSDTAEAES